MKLELTKKQYRRLLDMVYIGNWVLNSTRGEDRIPEMCIRDSSRSTPTTRSPRR